MRQRGFTVVEMIVVIIIIGIIASLTTAQMLRSQAVARDKERADDVSSIASQLEEIYKTGQPDGRPIPITNDGLNPGPAPMGYPSTRLISSPTDLQSKAIMDGIDQRALNSPLKKTMSLLEANNANGASATSAGGRTLGPTAANDIYVYQPLYTVTLASGPTDMVCTDASASPSQVIAPRLVNVCTKFNIYYYSEIEQTVKVKRSINNGTNGL